MGMLAADSSLGSLVGLVTNDVGPDIEISTCVGAGASGTTETVWSVPPGVIPAGKVRM